MACAPDVAEPPHVSLQHLSRAVQAGDTATTLRYVDLDAIVARLIHDVLAAVRDSLNVPADDTLIAEFRAHVDSIEREWIAILRRDLGLAAPATAHGDTARAASEPVDEELLAPDPNDDGVLAEGAEIVGDGAVRFVHDTALVERVVRYAHLDTSVTLTLALVPVERRHWRLVGLHNAVRLGAALLRRQLTILERANAPRQDSIRARVVVRDVTVRREPLEEWDRYAAEVYVTMHNRSPEPLTLHAAHLVGPRLPLADSVGQLLSLPLTLPPSGTSRIVWRRPLRGDHMGPYDVVARPKLYRVEIVDIELARATHSRIRLYRTWQDFVEENPLPAPSSGGVLACTSTWGSAERC
jgi:hypothetical protein